MKRVTMVVAFEDRESMRIARGAVRTLQPATDVEFDELGAGSEGYDRLMEDRVARSAVIGGLVGVVLFAVVSYAVTMAVKNDVSLALAVSAALALTGGPFFGALAGFALGNARFGGISEELRKALRVRDRPGALLLVRTDEPALVGAALIRSGGDVVCSDPPRSHAAETAAGAQATV
jgi:hypothetical protein